MMISPRCTSYVHPRYERSKQYYHHRKSRNSGIHRSKQQRYNVNYLEPIPEEEQHNYNYNNNNPSLTTLLQLANQERLRRGLVPFQESAPLNAAAARHAQRMACAEQVFHSVSCVSELQRVLCAPRVGESVQAGVSLSAMHWECWHCDPTGINRRNLLASQFDEYGSAVCASARTGRLYTCQFFRCSTTMQPPQDPNNKVYEDDDEPYSTAWLRDDVDDRAAVETMAQQ